MNLRCLLRLHKWEKYMGVDNRGDGKFLQKYICKKCKKINEVIS